MEDNICNDNDQPVGIYISARSVYFYFDSRFSVLLILCYSYFINLPWSRYQRIKKNFVYIRYCLGSTPLLPLDLLELVHDVDIYMSISGDRVLAIKLNQIHQLHSFSYMGL